MSSSTDAAFPILGPPGSYLREAGLTKREIFAAMAMQAFLIRGTGSPDGKGMLEASVIIADNLITALEKP